MPEIESMQWIGNDNETLVRSATIRLTLSKVNVAEYLEHRRL